MSTQPQLSSSVMGWKIWVFLRINQLHNQEKIFSTGTGFCQFSSCNMVKREGNVRSLVTMIYLPAKLFLLRPSGSVQDLLRYLPGCAWCSFVKYRTLCNGEQPSQGINTRAENVKKGLKNNKKKLCRYGSEMRAYLAFRVEIAFQGWFTESWTWTERVPEPEHLASPFECARLGDFPLPVSG